MRSIRNWIFWLKFYTWLAAINTAKGSYSYLSIIAFNSDFHPFIPGLEVKYAIEEAQKLNSKVMFGGMAIRNSDL